MHAVLEIIQKTLLISGFVLLLMILIEYLHVRTMGNWNKGFLKNPFFQVIVSIFLGLVPGCAGGFAVVSLYIHHFFSFPALMAISIATLGDDAFVIFATDPSTGFRLWIYLGIIAALVSGVMLLFRWNLQTKVNAHIQIHDELCCKSNIEISHQLRKITFQRALLLGILFLLFINMFLSPHDHEGHSHHSLSPETIIFLVMLLLTSFIIITVPEHFLTEHVWHHVLKKHFIKLFLWTLATIVFVYILDHYLEINNILSNNIWILLVLAIIIGIIPISGPHIVFYTLFMQNLIPFSVLLSNSIVQEGHAGIPLLAEDKKAFVINKIIKIVLALVLGIILIQLNV